MLKQVALCNWRSTVSRDHIGGNFFTVIPVLEGHSHGELNKRMSFQRIVDLQGGYVDTSSNDQFLEAARNEEKWSPVLVSRVEPLVAGTKPAPFESRLIGVFTLEVSGTHGSTADADFSPRHFRQWLSLVVEDGHHVVSQRHTNGGELVGAEPMTMLIGRKLVRQEAGIAGCFRQAVAMADRKMKPIFEARGCFFQQRSRTADESFKTAESVR